MFESALYYPHIDIHDQDWLKSAILFWDCIETIVPSAIQNPYRELAAYQCWREGILVPVRCDLHGEAITRVSAFMLRRFDDGPYWRHMDRLDVPHNQDTECLLHAEKMTHELRHKVDRYSRMHPDKLTGALRRELQHLENEPDDEGFIRVPRGFAAAYMCLLAYSLSKQIRSSPVTSSEDYRGVVLGEMLEDFSESEREQRQHRQAENSSAIVTLSMQALRFREDVDMKSIIRFRRDNADRLVEFRREVERLTDEVQRCENEQDAIDRSKRIYCGTIEPAIRRLQEDINGVGLSCITDGLIKIGTFSLPAAGLATLVGLSGGAALALSAGLTLSGITLKGYLDRRRMRAASPYTYLLDVHQKFAA